MISQFIPYLPTVPDNTGPDRTGPDKNSIFCPKYRTGQNLIRSGTNTGPDYRIKYRIRYHLVTATVPSYNVSGTVFTDLADRYLQLLRPTIVRLIL